MDLHQIEYMIAIEQEQSISRAAEKLFITQSALNQQLLKLEKELGLALFERRNRTMIPTFAGRIYLATAHQMVDMKQETYKILHEISKETAGEISVAFSPEQGARMFSSILPEFHRQYPNITFRIQEVHVKKMEQLLLQHETTIAFMSRTEHYWNPDLEYIEMKKEKLVLGLPASHPLAYLAGERSWETLPGIDLRLLRSEQFVLLSKSTRFRSMIDHAFSHAGFHPKVLFESGRTMTAVNIVKGQVAPAFFPQSYAEPNDQIVYFSLVPEETWTLCISYLKGSYLSKPEKYFMDLAIQYMNQGIHK